MIAAQIEDGIVRNLIVVDSLEVLPGLIDGAGAAIGDSIIDGAVVPKQAAPYNLAVGRDTLIRRVDADVDAIYAAVIGNRSDEYNAANFDATAYKATGYTGTVPSSVQSWADAKGWTAMQSADDILAAAAHLTTLRDTIRAQRLAKKEAARMAVDKAALDTVAGQWAAALASIRASAGL